MLVGGGDSAKTRRIGPEGIFRHAQGLLLNIERANWVQGRQPPDDLTMSQAVPSHRLRRGPTWALAGPTFGGINTTTFEPTHLEPMLCHRRSHHNENSLDSMVKPGRAEEQEWEERVFSL